MSCVLDNYDMACVFQGNEMFQDEYIFPEDITGWKIELEFKTKLLSNPAFKFTTEDGSIVITDALAGKAVRQSKQMTSAPNTYYADLTITKPLGVPETFIRQTVKIIETYQTQ